MEQEQIVQLIGRAFESRKNAYAPYSNFHVGAALLAANGKVYPGCNIENASYGDTVCAERVAFFGAVQEGERDFDAIAIVGGPSQEKTFLSDYAFPCGICRQVMSEFCRDDFQVIVARSLDDYQIHSLGELIPFGFGRSQLETA